MILRSVEGWLENIGIKEDFTVLLKPCFLGTARTLDMHLTADVKRFGLLNDKIKGVTPTTRLWKNKIMIIIIVIVIT